MIPDFLKKKKKQASRKDIINKFSNYLLYTESLPLNYLDLDLKFPKKCVLHCIVTFKNKFKCTYIFLYLKSLSFDRKERTGHNQ